MKTKFANGINPFTGERAETEKVVRIAPVSPDQLEVRNDPIPTVKTAPKYKYDDTFDQIIPGGCVACPSDRVSAVSGALRTYLKRKNKGGKVVSVQRYEDGRGRVWWVK